MASGIRGLGLALCMGVLHSSLWSVKLEVGEGRDREGEKVENPAAAN